MSSNDESRKKDENEERINTDDETLDKVNDLQQKRLLMKVRLHPNPLKELRKSTENVEN